MFVLKLSGIQKLLCSQTAGVKSGAVSAFWSGGWQIASEANRNFLPPPCTAAEGWQVLHGGANN